MRPHSLVVLVTLALSPLTQGSTRDVLTEQLGTDRFVLTSIGPTSPHDDDATDVLLPTPDGDLVLSLAKHSMRGSTFSVLTVDGESAAFTDAPPVQTWRGLAFLPTFSGPRPVAASITEAGVTAYIRLADGTARVVQPASDFDAQAPPGRHVIFDSDDVLTPAAGCAQLADLDDADPSANHDGPLHVMVDFAEIALEADLAFFQSIGTVNGTISNIETLMNAVSLIYENDTGITYLISALVIQTGPTENYPTNKHDKLLDQFEEHWEENFEFLSRDTAHLLHGKAIQGNVAGFAYVGVMCSNSKAYGWSHTTITGLFSFRVAITAHELGHNWNAKHCNGDADCEIMCAVIGSTGACTGGTGSFGQQSQNKIGGFKNGAGCIEPLPDPLLPPVHDTFAKLKTERWLIQLGVKTSKKAIGETSGSTSLGLDRFDRIRSNRIDLSGESRTRLEFYVAARGPEAGEELIVEGLDNGASWVELGRIAADGSVEDTFAYCAYDLSNSFLHDSFQVRMTTAVDEANDDFYVDDLRVFDPGPAAASLDASAIEPVTRTWPVSTGGAPSNATLAVANGGTDGTTLTWSAAEVVDVPWLSISPTSGSVTPAEQSDTITLQFNPNAQPILQHTAIVRLTNNANGSDTIDVPVSLFIHAGTFAKAGDEITGTIDPFGDSDHFAMTFAKGEKLKLTGRTTSNGLKAEVVMTDSIGTPITTFLFKKKESTQSVKIPEDDHYLFEVRAADGQSDGDYELTTKGKVAKTGKLLITKKKPPTAGGVVEISVVLRRGASLGVTVVPVNSGDGPFDIAVEDASGQPVDVAAHLRSLPTGGARLADVPIVVSGSFLVRISGFSAKEKVVVTVDPGLPADGDAILAID